MKKQVTFAGSLTVHRLRQDEASISCRGAGINEAKTALREASNGLKMNRPPAVRCEPQLEHMTTIKIPKTMTAAPFLKHAALTPAQKEFLYTIAASHSGTHVRHLITQHYMNVLHRCIRAGYKPEGDHHVGTPVTLPETNDSDNHRSEVPSRAKHKEKINMSARNPGKSFHPKIPNKRARSSDTSASKQRKMKKCATTSLTLRRKSPRSSRLLEEDEDEEEQVDSLSDCLSSLSVGEWDDDTFSRL